MFKYTVKNKRGFEFIKQGTEQECLEWLEMFSSHFGLSERIVIKEYSEYDLADVIEEIAEVKETKTRMVEVIDEEGNLSEVEETYEEIISPARVKLKPEYTIEIEDISAKVEQEKINAEALKFLADSDWKIWRHREQLENNIPTKLTNDEYQLLLVERQQARDAIVR